MAIIEFCRRILFSWSFKNKTKIRRGLWQLLLLIGRNIDNVKRLYLLQGVMYIMYVSALSFFSRISDPRFGGTYMTLLNTVASLGVSWSSTAALRMIDLLTFTECSSDSTNNCSSQGLEDVRHLIFKNSICQINYTI